MRDLPSGSNPEPTPVTRIFAPSDLNLDDLAEAIRSLLESASQPPASQASRPNPNLLSSPRRVSHVVEDNEKP